MPTPANALAIMAKAPLVGSVKTRLVPALTAEQAAGLYRALLLDQFDHLRNFAGAERYVFYTPADAENLLRDLAGADYTYLAQSDGDLGVRMRQVFTDLRLRGHRNIVLIGSDLPALPWSILDQAFEQLAGAQARVVLGPSRDGGYYLLGMNRPTPEIFAHMTWSHPRVLAETTMRLDANNLDTRQQRTPKPRLLFGEQSPCGVSVASIEGGLHPGQHRAVMLTMKTLLRPSRNAVDRFTLPFLRIVRRQPDVVTAGTQLGGDVEVAAAPRVRKKGRHLPAHLTELSPVHQGPDHHVLGDVQFPGNADALVTQDCQRLLG